MSGSGDGATPTFAVRAGAFTVRIACTGEGRLAVGIGRDEVAVPCDAASRRVHVATDDVSAAVRVVASPTARWTLAVVTSADFATTRPGGTRQSSGAPHR